MNRLMAAGALCAAAAWAGLVAVEAPTEAEWKPIAAAIEAKAPDARERLAAFMADRKWTDGWVKLAELDRAANDLAACEAHARRAVAQGYADDAAVAGNALNRERHERLVAQAAGLQMYALNRLGRAPEAVEVIKAFDRRRDPQGLACLYGAEAVLAVALAKPDDAARIKVLRDIALSLLARGKEQADSVGADFHVLEGRLYESLAEAQDRTDAAPQATASLKSAEQAYGRAVAAGAATPGNHYTLGRIRRLLALRSSPEGKARGEYLQTAAASFRASLNRPDAKDPEARLALGLTLIDLRSFSDAHLALTAAVDEFETKAKDDATAQPLLAAAYRSRGQATVELANQIGRAHV